MEVNDKLRSDFIELYELHNFKIKLLLDSKANLFWQSEDEAINPLDELPWNYQLPFYLKFLHNDRLSERFKNLSILGAIDVFVKSKFMQKEILGI